MNLKVVYKYLPFYKNEMREQKNILFGHKCEVCGNEK